MSTPLLTTKLYIPPPRSGLVPRPRLVAQLNQGLRVRLTLVSAPAGFGKTTLVSAWLEKADIVAGWLSLDEADSELTRFLTYFIAAIRAIGDGTIGETTLSILQAPQLPPVETILTPLINDLATAGKEMVLVLDDYHLVTAPRIHQALAFLLDHIPPNIHILLITRSDPPLPLSRLRVRGEMAEIRMDDLRFSIEEAALFLEQVTGVQLSAEDVMALESRTEGWVAGLQLAAISMRGQKDVSAFVKAFTGSHRLVVDYLLDEVLDRQPAERQLFLLQIAILDRFCGDLCNAVTGQKSGQITLEQLEQNNLFIILLDDERRWYRYHHLFADLLRHRLRRRHPELISVLYQKASQWYAEREDVETAVHYALAGDDVAEAVRLLDESALIFLRRSEVRKLHLLLEQLPADTHSSYPRLNLARAWAFMFMGEYDNAEMWVRRSEESLPMSAELPAEFPEALARASGAAIRAYIATRQEDLPRAIAFSNKALAWLRKLPEDIALQLRGTVLINLGQIQTGLNDVAAAASTYRQALLDSKANGRIFSVLAAYGSVMIAQRMRGQLGAAKAMGMEGLAWIATHKQDDQFYPAEGEIRRELGQIFYEQDQLNQAKTHLEKGVDLYRFAHPENYARLLNYLFLIELAGGNLDAAILIHLEIEPILIDLPPIRYRRHAANRIERIRRLSRAQPEEPKWPEELRRWLASLDTYQTPTSNTRKEPAIFIRVRVLATLGQPEAALDMLNPLADAAESAARYGDLIQYRVQQALILSHLSQQEAALTHLNQAIALAESTGYVRTFIDEGPAMKALLKQARKKDSLASYVDKLMGAFGDEAAQPKAEKTPILPANPDQLSERELTVLRLMASGRSGPQIAEQLYLSINTIKTHTKNIYSKLGVNQRFEAIQRAKDLNLI